ncbi:non-ribosomal peptide synthetase [Mycoavidus sp. SF9855]|uniref:non-ribosomal peptide synthetase n=1 Tax=Mycoavidus sp. SF9855 TaxID=2968475 RepID=UPI00211CBCB2|nr:non-ribosomal peptide synthetase [Mycoavidus sp. SF9855]UUM21367.1 non-ribosomal peptide synthase/polyketide synthase [Mycoavidus sp. SF9855]
MFMHACIKPVTYPLSAAQMEIWLAQQIKPQSPVYNISQFTEIHGIVDPTLFEAALQQVVLEAQSLCLQFTESDDGLQQFVGSLNWSLPLIDVSAEVDPQAAAEAWMRADYEQPIDLLHSLPFGYALLKVAPDRFLWYQRYHHIVMDGIGGVLIAQRMAQMYSARVKGVAAKECPFGSVSLLLENDARYRASAQFPRDRAYWLKHCADWPKPVTLADRPAPALYHRLRQTTYLRSQSVRTHASDASRLAQLIMAAMAAYLHRLIGAQDVVLGFPGTARLGEDRRIPGTTANVLPVRFTVQPDMSLSLLMEQAAQEIQRGFRHQRYRSEALRRELGLAQSQPLFGPTINLMPFDYKLSFGKHSSTNHNLVNGPVEDLMIVVYTLSDDGPLRIDFDANPTLYTADELIAYQCRFLKFLDALASEPTQPISGIDLLDAAERRQLLVEWNATGHDYPAHQCIHRLFEEQVERTPEATALVYADQVWSYAELNAHANRLAHQLIELGVQPDACVAICVERSPAMVVGLLAILKAGGAYVPLDPVYPGERLTHILADATPTILLADAAGRTALGEAALASLIVLDPNRLPQSPITNPQVPGLTPHHLAYVIYTSGSTGTPKGVMVEHAQIVRLFDATAAWYHFNQHDTWCLFHSFAFDFSVWELWGALRYGGKLVLVPHHITRSPQEFYRLVCEQGITVLNQTPSAFKSFIASQAQSALRNRLRYVIFGGEALEPAILQAWYATCSEHAPQLVNMYGITETTVHVTYRPLQQQDSEQIGSPIGVRIPDLKVYLLDAYGQPVPLGVAGELYIGGAGVARGYLNRPDLTAERFLPDPFSDHDDARMYKTGDLARYLPDGNLMFLGRNDHQVKLRGFRIESAEIEACLVEHPQVREAVVLARGEGSDKHLVAYVVAEPDEQLASTLRAYLAARLPEYMVPTAFVRLDALPLTPNGKLDRQALPAPDDEAFAHQVYEAPQGEIETALAAIWAELLHVEQISRHDSFFALGGHSLLAIRLMNRVAALGAELPLAALFDSPCLAAFAAVVNKRLTQEDSTLPTITPVSRKDILPPSFAQQRLWFLAQLDGISDNYHIPLAIRLRGALDRAAWQQALNTLFARHEALRSVFVTIDGQPQVQLLAPELGLPMHWHDLRGKPNAHAQLESLSAQEAKTPFDLAQGPLIRARLIQLADNEHVFLLTQHHIVSDDWSLGVLLQELNALYTAYRAGEPCPLPPLAIQYPDYAAWQRQWLSGKRLQTQRAYWRKTLADAPVLLNLPTDRPRPPQQSFAGAQVPVRLDAKITRLLKRLGQEHGATLFMTLLAAWGAVLSRLSGQDDLIIGTPSANRNHREIESLLGFFVNTLALRIDLASEPNTVQLLERVRHSTMAAQAHQNLPFEQVVEIVQPPRKLDHTPLFQVMFAWQNNEVAEWRLPALEVTPVALSYNTVKFDLELNLQEAGDEIIGDLRYATALFDRQTIERQVGYLQAMLRAMTADAQQSISTVDILAPTERTLLLETWNATAASYPEYQCIHQLFEAQVERTPQATALVYEDQVLTYAELNAHANCLAYQLIELGVQPDARVAICVEHSPVMVVGLLAILKAGGAYVPLDPAYPGERLTHILADATPAILLADAVGRAALSEMALASLTVLDPNVLLVWPISNPQVPGLNSHHLAYVIYTSGSTGTPKGVMVEHRGVVNLAQAQIACFEVHPSSRVLQFASPSFDASVSEIFMALGCGAGLYLLPDIARRDRNGLWDYLARYAITHVTLPPALLQDGEDLPSLNIPLTLILAGEAPGASLLQTLIHQGVVFNAYGPTEITVCATAWRCSHDLSSEVVPIGRPISNIRVYLLDTHGQPVPLGVVGELYIGGAGVARGYLNRPDLTAERFLPDPFSDRDDAHMYKTGDLARYLPDGNLMFLGRNDHQVKLRGFRIEPAEIEACLVEHPRVREAAVLAREDGSDKHLVAYVVAEPDEQLARTLRAHLADRLPEYMTPAAFVRLDALLLTPNGKLDRQALPAPDDEAFAHQLYEAPQGEIETALAAIWAELLGLEHISRHDNFFALGGHSLLAVQMIERLRHIGLAVSVRTLFDTPTLNALAQSLGQHHEVATPPNGIASDTTTLTPDLLPLINLTQAEIDHIVEQTPGGVANIQDIYALSPLQDGILFHHLLATEGDPYLLIVQMAFANRALLDRYLDAVQQVINRHDILRTAFVWESLSASAQVVWRHAPLSITELTLGPADGAIAEQLTQRFDPRQHRIDLTQAPLLRFAIAQDSNGRWLLVQLLHHLIGDHSTLEGMQAEIQAFLKGQGDALPTPQPFRNLVAQARLGLSPQAHERFFTDMLAEVNTPTLPFGLAEVYRDGAQVNESHHMLPQDLNDRLRAQAKRVGVSLASLCHLAYAQVIARASGQQRVVFGTVLFGRVQAGVGMDCAMMGLFINTLPLRIDLDSRGVQDSVRDTHARLAALLEHEHASLALAQRCSGVSAEGPLFSALLNYRHHAMPLGESPTVSGIEFLGAQERTNYPFTLSVEDFGATLGLTAQVVQPLDPARMCSYMQQTLQSLAKALEHAPDMPVWQLEVLPIEERECLLETWNATATPYPEHQCTHQLFEEQVERTPHATALEYEEQVWSYAELNTRANCLAHQLIELGVQPGDYIATLLERSVELVAAQLAILKAGAAYVPIDPQAPAERQTWILADCAARLLVTDTHTEIPAALLTPLLRLASRDVNETDVSAANPDLVHSSLDTAYVMYTSGSTGVPKGVLVPHRAIARLVINNGYADIGVNDRVAFAANPAFDASTFEVWAPLLNGGRIVIINADTFTDPQRLANALCRHKVTSLFLTTVLFNQFVLAIGPALAQLKYLLCGGEQEKRESFVELLKNGGPSHLIHCYGPTESTTFSTTYEVSRLDDQLDRLPIGRPIANTRLYLLDAHGQPVPLGVVGELYIGGAGVARGYLNRPELTAERFLPDPFSDRDDARMYKTGDLARYLPDGNLMFFGRNDHQVKIRGFRIEPAEVEARLVEHPQVQEAAVLARSEGNDKRLVAYVVAEPDEQLASTLRAHLADRLPEYMVPAAFVRLDALPLTPNGKLDRRALPAPDNEAFARQAYEAPQGEIETALAGIWAELLNVEQISRHDSFFALGGHSLLAVRMIERLRRLGLTVSVRALFDTPTLSVLAQSLGQHHEVAIPPNGITPNTDTLTPDLLPLIDLTQAEIDCIVAQTPGEVANIQDIYALSPLQDGILFHHLLATEGDPYLLIAQMAFANRALLNRYLDAVQQVANRHDILRTAFVWKNLSSPVQVVWRHAPLSITELTLDPADGSITEQLTQRFDPRQYRIDLTQAPLLRFAIAQNSDGRWLLVQLLHHLIGDHSTLDVMNTEVQAFLEGRGDALPAPQPFRNLVAQARLGLSQQAHERFFTDMLVEVEAPTLPFGLAEVHRDGAQVTESHHMLPQDLNDRLRAQAKRVGVSLASLCHLAWAQVIARASGQQRVVFGTVLFGRMQAGAGADRAMGLFINTLPLRVDLDDTGVKDRVRNTHARLAALLEHEHASLALAQRCSSVPAGAPLFSALLNYRHNAMPSGKSPTASGMEFLGGQERTNYPFTLSVEDFGAALGLTAQVVQPLDPVRVCGYMEQTLQSLAQALEHTPDMPVWQLEVLPIEERERLLETWNATATPYPEHLCIHQLFEEQVERTPHATALEYEDQVWSYAELNTRANCLAHQLIELGVQPGDYIATLLERSVELVAAQLAILKVGAAYVPIDPQAPAERQTWILADCAARLLVTDTHTEIPAALLTPLLRLASRDVNETDVSAANPDLVHSSLDTAYVMYTSGSTGVPKGVLVPHRAIARLVINNGYADIGVNDRVAFAANPAFDASTFEVWAPLLNGGTLVVIDRDTVLTPDAFVRTLQEKHISIMWLTVGLFNQLAVALEPVFPQLKILIVGGDALDASVIAQVLRNTPPQQLINGYGPTESTTFATTYRIGSLPEEGISIPIGRPIANTQLYLLDAHGQPVPLGAVGELYIGGAGVARGYLNRPELTAERFLPDPFSEHDDARMYKTGDLARYLPDGNLEFLGRNDQQVKLRGFRIELGEIEARLIEHPQVREAAVLALDENGGKRLIAYVVAEPDEQLVHTLRAHLAAGLPEYMVPAVFVRLDVLPLTPNGKLDRQALPAPDNEAFAHQTYEAPQGEIETALAGIWAELLNVEQISRHDSFFALGGHSLLVVQMIERLRRLGLTISARALFDTPTLSVLAQSVGQHREVATPPNGIKSNTATLTPDLLPLIDLTQAEIDRIVEQTPGGVANIQDIYALSPLQDGILFHHLLATEGDPYLLIAQMAFANRALLDRYLDAVQQVVNRHDILRTAFVWESLSTPAQVVWRHAPLSITELTLDPADGPITEQLTQRFDPRQHRIELTQAPLLRFVITQNRDGRWLLVQLLHHLIGDHSTLDVMQAEIQAFLEGRGDALPAPQPFRNLVAQVRLGLSPQAHERFFIDMLAEVEAPTLPFGLTEVHRDGVQVNESHHMLPQDLNDRLRAQAKRVGVSLASLCHLAWAQVLARASGQQRVVFGTVLFGRMQAGEGADRAMGLFVNTLPLRIDLDSLGVQDSVRQTHARLAALLEQEHASLALAQRCSSVPAGTPLFSALLNYRHNAMPSGEGPTVSGMEFLGGQERTNYPFTLSVEDCGIALGLTAQVVEPLDPARVCGYMQQTLQSLAEALEHTPDMPVWQLEVLPIEERECLLETWNATATPYPEHQCIHRLFEEQVERTPEATALVYADQVWSYAELNAHANRLAHQLIELGVQPDACVAICVERSPAMVVGLLAILKAGGAYVPLDPVYPGERLTHILADATPTILLADAAGRTALGEAALASLIVLDPNRLPQSPITNPQVPGLTPHHLAYVIYTSGSTGTPKGVMVEHAQIVRLFDATAAWYHFNQHDTWCLFHSFAFDFSVWELWGALRYGGKLVLVPHHITRSPQEFYRLVCEQGITVLNQTPSAFKSFIASQAQSALRNRLRYVIFGGEALEPAILQAWYATCSEHAPQLVNMYGITETTVHVTYRPLQQQDSEQIGSPIGVRIPDLKVYLLDAYGQPVPLGVAGELYIGGAGVARGYLNRPDLTTERFLPDPFSDHDDARMYKTGDLARYLPDGNLMFLGRNDHQVKLRGFRIESAEIEACLVEHPQVREAAVLARGEGSDKHLVAYVVAEPDEQLASTLRAYLAARLPEYMVPTAFVRLDALPLTPNGKLDRRALPAPDDEAFAHQVYEAPQGEIETALAGIWAELLGLERVSRHDSFFALGGHSLLAVQMIERLRRLGLTISVRTLFDTPTLSVLAQSVGQHHEVATPPNLITPNTTTLTPDLLPLIDLAQDEIDRIVEQTLGGVANIQDIYALSPLQDGILFHHLLATEGDPYLLIAQMAFANRALLDRYLDAVQQVVNRHDILRTAFVWKSLSTPAQVVWRHAPLSITELTLDPADGPITEQLTQRFDPRQHRIELTQAPLLRFVITQNKDGRWLLVQLLHHLIGDHSTLDVMQAEIQAFLEDRGDALPAPQPFRNLVAQARLGLSQQAHEHFFNRMLVEVDAPTLPFGLAEVHRNGAQVCESHRMLPQDLNDRLRVQAKRVGVSLASLCHLAWAQVLARASGQQRVVFGTVLFGRMQAGEGADRAMGLFINTLPLRIDLDSRGVKDSVRQTHACLAALLEHEHASLALAQRCSGVPVGAPLFSALLNYRHNAMPSGEGPTVSGMEFLGAQERTNYPFTLSVEDCGIALALTAQVVEPLDPARVCGYMQQTLQSLAEALEHTPDMPVWQLEVLPIEERECLLETWNATATPYPEHQCIHQLFEEQVERTPEATALVYEDQVWSYAELNAHANRLAHQLIALGVQPDARVAICVERSPAMVVGLLAILKAGGAYVPLDPAYPGERLTHILADATPTILLADAAGRAALGEAAASLIVLDPNRLPQSPITNPQVPGLTSHHLAYVIYTSGSTGMPKGVMVEHCNLSNLCTWHIRTFDLHSGCRSATTAGVAFDASAWEIWPSLACGGTLSIPPHAVSDDVLAMLQWWHQQRLDVTFLVTPLAVMALSGGQTPSSVRHLLTGGDRFPCLPEGLPSGLTLVNNYGPTEATVVATSGPQNGEDSRPHIGRPIANTCVYLLDTHGQPAPLGAVGELYIGGAGVARGYLNQPDLTAERFLPDPFSGRDDARMYKTGDLARYLPDGNLMFLGRNDQQVKIRGFRIEPAEIEACLVEHPQVREAAVLARGEGSDKHLVAYVVAEPDEQLARTLRAHLADRLPEYMTPAAFVRLDALPLTPNGKLDRQALPAPDDEAFAHQLYEAPQGEIETALAGIWAELLGLERISRHDSFFALGGHSLLAMQMTSRIHTTLGVEIALRTLFEAPTVMELAQRLFKLDGAQDDSFAVLLPIKPTGTQPPLFCVHPAAGLSWSYIALSKYLNADQPVYGLQARGLNGVPPLAKTIDAMASDYIRQIRRIQPGGPYYLLGWSFGGSVAHSMATQLEQQGEKVALLALLDSYPDYSQRSNEPEMDQEAAYIKLFGRYGDKGIPDAGEYLWGKTRDVIENNCHIAMHFSPLIYGGDVLFFRATITEDESIPLTPDLWKPYVLGNVEIYDIHCKHEDMDRPAPTAEIGHILAQKLDELQKHQPR